MDFTSFFCNSAFFSGFTDVDDSGVFLFVIIESDVEALTDVDGAAVFFSIADDDDDVDGLDSSASLDAALTAAAP